MPVCAVFDLRFDGSFCDEHKLFKCLVPLAKSFVFQRERGGKTGYEHWQVRLSLWKKTTRAHARNLIWTGFQFPKEGVSVYCEPTSNPTSTQNNAFNYVMKLDTRVDGPWSDKDAPHYVPRQFRMKPRKWQRQVLDTANEFDDRKIDCIIDPQGGLGKSFIMGKAWCKYRYPFISVVDDTARIIYSACDILIGRQEREPKLMIVDVPRAFNRKKMGSLMTAIEILKSGIISDSRNKFRHWEYDSPRIWVFMNFDVDLTLQSSDRWQFWTVSMNVLCKKP